MAMMTRLVQLEAGEIGVAENERITRGAMSTAHAFGEQGQGMQAQSSRELHSPRRHEHTEAALQGVPL